MQESRSIIQMRFSTNCNQANLKIELSIYEEQRNWGVHFKDPLSRVGKGSKHSHRLKSSIWLSVFEVMLQ